MSEPHETDQIEGTGGAHKQSVSAAKAGLLVWAERSDASGKRARSHLGAIAVRVGIGAMFGGIVLRMIAPRGTKDRSSSFVTRVGKGAISWAVLARVGNWVLPHAIRAARSKGQPGAPSTHEAARGVLVAGKP